MEGDTRSNPSVAIKFLRDGVPSANMVFMESFNGREGMSFFEPDLTNHPERILGEVCQNTAQKKLSSGTQFPFSQGTLDWSSTNEGGEQAANPVFPFEMKLVATESLRQASADWASTDVGFGAEYFNNLAIDLLTLPIDEASSNTIWDLMARAQPNSDLVKVGSIQAKDSF